MARFLAPVVAILVALQLLTACRPSEPDRAAARRPVHVLLISLDTTRADHLGCYGHPAGATPNIDRLAAGGVLFESCVSSAPITLPSHATMLTGKQPIAHGARDNGLFTLRDDNALLSEALRAAGFRTLAQVSAFVLNREFGLAQGFDAYRDVRDSPAETEVGTEAQSEARPEAQRAAPVEPGARMDASRAGQAESRARSDAVRAGRGAWRAGSNAPRTQLTAEQVTDGAIELLEQAGRRPFFLFAHYFDPHEPHAAPERFTQRFEDAYLAEIAYADEQVGRLIDVLRRRGLLRSTLIVLTADHGEGRGEHGELTHANFLYDSTLRVPLIVAGPGVREPGRRVSELTRTADIAPTILDALGLPPLPDADGVSFAAALRAAAVAAPRAAAVAAPRAEAVAAPRAEAVAAPPRAYSETWAPYHTHGFSPLWSLRSAEWKYIHGPRPELYHVASDPGERNNLAAAEAARVGEMRDELRGLIEAARGANSATHDPALRSVSTEELMKLRALGYLGTGAGDTPLAADLDAFDTPVGPNPADHLDEIRLADNASRLLDEGRHAEVEATLRALLKQAGPRGERFAWAQSALAGALLAQGKAAESLPFFERSLAANPRDGRALTMFGMALAASGRRVEAIDAYRRALEIPPVSALTYRQLGLALLAEGEAAEAAQRLREALEQDAALARDATALQQLATAEHASGQIASALATLQKAIELAQDSGDRKLLRKLRAQRRAYAAP